MTEAVLTDSSAEEGDPTQPNQFSLDVEINGLPYVLEGEQPSAPADFDLVVSLPPDKWAEIQPQIKAEVAFNNGFARQYHFLQPTEHLGEGRVGSVWVHAAQAEDQAPSIGVLRIQTNNMWVPEGSEYHDARGVGTFILDSLCAIADVRGWRIYLEPVDRGGRLQQGDLYEWYQRHGFMDIESRGRNSGLKSTAGGMVRLPQEPDPEQPVTRMLSA